MRKEDFKLPKAGKKRFGHSTHTTRGRYIRWLNKIGYFDRLVEKEKKKYQI